MVMLLLVIVFETMNRKPLMIEAVMQHRHRQFTPCLS
jgi:hypothetical protein